MKTPYQLIVEFLNPERKVKIDARRNLQRDEQRKAVKPGMNQGWKHKSK